MGSTIHDDKMKKDCYDYIKVVKDEYVPFAFEDIISLEEGSWQDGFCDTCWTEHYGLIFTVRTHDGEMASYSYSVEAGNIMNWVHMGKPQVSYDFFADSKNHKDRKIFSQLKNIIPLEEIFSREIAKRGSNVLYDSCVVDGIEIENDFYNNFDIRKCTIYVRFSDKERNQFLSYIDCYGQNTDIHSQVIDSVLHIIENYANS